MRMFDFLKKIVDVDREKQFSTTPVTHLARAKYVNVVNYIDEYNKKSQKYEELKLDDINMMAGHAKTLYIGINSHDETNLLAAAIYVKSKQEKDFFLQETNKNKEKNSFLFILPEQGMTRVSSEVPPLDSEVWGFLDSENTFKHFINHYNLNPKYAQVKENLAGAVVFINYAFVLDYFFPIWNNQKPDDVIADAINVLPFLGNPECYKKEIKIDLL